MTVLITLDGVLRQEGTDSVDRSAERLYAALSEHDRVVILGGENPDKDEWFLATSGLTAHADYVHYGTESALTPLGRRLAQVARVRAQGSVDLVIDPDPSVVASLLDDGVPSCLYLHPRFTRPSFRPDYRSDAKPWDELVAVIEFQDRMKVDHNPLPPLDEEEAH